MINVSDPFVRVSGTFVVTLSFVLQRVPRTSYVKSAPSSRSHHCPFCQSEFPKKPLLHDHLQKVHAVTQQIVCQICQKIFQTKHGLNQHMHLHTGKSMYNCEQCGHNCTSTTQLEGHMNKHRGIKPYKCPLCNVAYYYSHSLSAHQKKTNHYY